MSIVFQSLRGLLLGIIIIAFCGAEINHGWSSILSHFLKEISTKIENQE